MIVMEVNTGAFSWNVGKLFSELKLVTDNLLFIYAEANWEATERKALFTLQQGSRENLGIIYTCSSQAIAKQWFVVSTI